MDASSDLERQSEPGASGSRDAARIESGEGAAAGDRFGLGESELAELPVSLDIRLSSTVMPLSSFVELAPGSVLDLGADLTAPVDILANGRAVGAGRLVKIDDRVGVQIQRWRDG